MKEKLSIKDRLILANQYEILAKLAEDEYDRKNYENLRNVFVSGYSWGYSLATEYFLREMNDAECRFVLDVLNMYRTLYFSRENNEKIKESVDEDEVLFKGFDANDGKESRYLSFCSFLIDDLGRYAEIKEFIEAGKIESLNSHGSGPSMERLSRMVEKAKEIDKIRHERNDLYYTKEEVEQILSV